MKMKNLLIAIAIGAASLCVSCDKKPVVQPNITLKAEVTDITLGSLAVNVTVSAATDTYYETLIAKSDYTYADGAAAAAAIVADLKTKVTEGKTTWAKELNIGSKKIVHNDLEQGDEYKIVVFGLRGDGSISSDVVVLDAKVLVYTIELKVDEVNALGFDIHINPSLENGNYYFGVEITSDITDFYGCETIEELVMDNYEYIVKEDAWDDATLSGKFDDTWTPYLNPDTDYTVFCVGLDSDHKIVTEIYSTTVTTLSLGEYDKEGSNDSFGAGVKFIGDSFVLGVWAKQSVTSYSYMATCNDDSLPTDPAEASSAILEMLQESVSAYWAILADEYDGDMNAFLQDLFYAPETYPIMWLNLAPEDFYAGYFDNDGPKAGDKINVYVVGMTKGEGDGVVALDGDTFVFSFEMPAAAPASAPRQQPSVFGKNYTKAVPAGGFANKLSK